MAAELCKDGDRVLDAACGIGYGAAVIGSHRDVFYLGIDMPGVPGIEFMEWGEFAGADLDTWTPSERYDLGCCFETLEHLKDPARFARVLTSCCDTLIVSTPTVPTKHMNPYHLHDFTLEELIGLFPDMNVVSVVPQPEELSHIVTLESK